MEIYTHQLVEKKWQKRWMEQGVGEVSESEEQKANSLYHLVMFPYPSGAGLHVGHVESFTAVDILSRFERMRGKHVLQPIGFDAFGLPAENYAIKTGVHPEQTTKMAIEAFTRQMQSLGLSYAWSRVVSTADPSYYKWTQWLFLLLYKHGLAYRAHSSVNWCVSCATVLANEQVVNGNCERCGKAVIQKALEQWFFRITQYAERLLNGLDSVDWPEKIKAMQRHWIGKSEGAEVVFEVEGGQTPITIFTTRIDTLFGVSYLVISPEHPVLTTDLIPDTHRSSVAAYKTEASRKTDLERSQLQREKTGVFSGVYAIHPMTGERVPVWVADYVLSTYGTGAVMGVPAHDERDFAFATHYQLPIKQVIRSSQDAVDTLPYLGEGTLFNSGTFSDLTSSDASEKIVQELERQGKGRSKITYRLRDWLVSRQRYWGAPIPMIWCDTCGLVPEEVSHLPIQLPNDVDFRPTGESPLTRSESFHAVTCPKCGIKARRESDTMDTFVDSSWYFLRYADPHNNEEFASKEKMAYWAPVDLYMGGAEHAVLHLLYARFFTYVLHDLGFVAFEEPFTKLWNQGLILGPDGEKMSKSKGNVVNPDEMVLEYGADTLRLYEMFMGPLEDAKPWDTKGVIGVRRFLDRIYTLCRNPHAPSDAASVQTALHLCIQRFTQDTERLKFNTAIAHAMSCLNILSGVEAVSRSTKELFLRLLAPYAPHLCEELWEYLGNKTSIFATSFPIADESLLKQEETTMVVQINGKVRASFTVPFDLPEAELLSRVQTNERIQFWLTGKQLVRHVLVPNKVLNLVVEDK